MSWCGFCGTNDHRWSDLDASCYSGDKGWFHDLKASVTFTFHPRKNEKKMKKSAFIDEMIASVFWDAKSVLLHNAWSDNAVGSIEMLCRLKEAVCLKRTGCSYNVVLHANATLYTAKLTRWLQQYGWYVLSHPLHSPTSALSDYYLFGLLIHLFLASFHNRDYWIWISMSDEQGHVHWTCKCDLS